MKLTFEGKTFLDILNQIEDVLTGVANTPKNISVKMSEKAKMSGIPLDELVGPGGPGPIKPQGLTSEAAIARATADDPVDNAVDKSVDKPVDPRIAKMRAAKAAKAAERAALAAQPKKLEPSVEEMEEASAKMDAAIQALPDPVDLVKLRTQTVEELQSAYANGHQKEVFELLSRFGNGAKSFRELPPEAFLPIRQAIDNGALT